MISIRKGVFETNSSSTHSICISKTPVDIPKGKKVHFTFGEYGWGEDTVYDTASYLYTGIFNNKVKGQMEKLKSMLDEIGVEYDFEEPGKDRWGYEDAGYVDHSYELNPFIEAVLSDKDLLARYLFGDSFIATGNDNDESCAWVDSFDNGTYDYFYKGN